MTTRKKILFVSTRAPYPPTTGHFQRTYNILIRLARVADVHFFGFYDKGLDQGDKEIVLSELARHCERVDLLTLPGDSSWIPKAGIVFQSLRTGKPVVAIKYDRPEMRRAIRRRMNETEFDLVHLDMLPLVEYSNDFPEQPVVLTNHNVESERLFRLAVGERNFFYRKFLTMQARQLLEYETEAIRRLSYVVAVSESDRDTLARVGGSARFLVVPNGTDASYYALSPRFAGTPDLGPVILWVGSAQDPYNAQAIRYFSEEIFPTLIQALPEVTFRFVGKMDAAECGRLKTRFGDSFDFRGFVDDVRPHYAEAKLVCIPLLSGSGTKLKVIEALAMGRAVVTTPVGAEGLAVEHDLHLSIAGEASELISEILDLLGNDERRRRFEQAGRRLVESLYDWDEIAAKQWSEYLRIIDEAKHSCAA